MSNPRIVRASLGLCCALMLVAGAQRAASHPDEAQATKAARIRAAAAAEKGRPTPESTPAAAAAETNPALPGPQHQWMKHAEGSWKATIKMWMAPGEPTVSEGTSENRMIMGGRYLEQRFSGSFMGQPFEGFGLTGYDNLKQEYWSTWIDNTSTGVMLATGKRGTDDQTLTLHSTGTGPDGTPMKTRSVSRVVDGNQHVFSMYGEVAGKESLMMEITYTRAGAD